jgi:vacuolar protein sorting-associated protein 13B
MSDAMSEPFTTPSVNSSGANIFMSSVIEGLVASLVQSSLDRYIKNIRREDFNLSIWGGDVALRNVEIRLDAVQRDFLPLLPSGLHLESGIIKELLIHIPWTSLGSAPVVITLNTVELSVVSSHLSGEESMNDANKKTDTATSSGLSTTSDRTNADQSAPMNTEESPGYFLRLMSSVKNNFQVVVNNASMTYIQQDLQLVLSFVKAETFTVNGDWVQTFVDIAPPSFTMHKVTHQLFIIAIQASMKLL